MIRLKALLAVLGVATVVGTSVLFPATASAACQSSYFGIPAWYAGMQGSGCGFEPIKSGAQVDVTKTAGRIALNIVQALLVVAGYVAVFFIFKAGFNYIYSAGSPDGMANAKKTLMNAVIGLVIALLAASIVGLVAGKTN
jgi:hypothetical protein